MLGAVSPMDEQLGCLGSTVVLNRRSALNAREVSASKITDQLVVTVKRRIPRASPWPIMRLEGWAVRG